MSASRGPRRLARRGRTPRQRAWDLLRATDPGWDRARTSLRAVLAAAIGGAATAGVLVGLGQSPVPAALAVVVGVFGGITLPASGPRGRHLARVGGAFTGSALLTALLLPWPLAARGALLAAIAGGAWAGRWGPPGVGLGLLAFLGSFFVLLVGIGPEQAPAVGAAGAIGTLALGMATRWVVPDRPAVLLGRLVRSLVAQTSLLVDAAEVLVADGPGGGRQRRLRRRLLAVQEVALLVDGTLDVQRAADAVTDPARVRSDVLVVEALADHLAWAVLTVAAGAPPRERAALAAAMRRARVPEDVDVGQAVTPLVPRLAGRDDRVVEVLERLAAAVEGLVHAARPVAPDPVEPGRSATATAEAPLPPPTPIARTTVQAIVAGAAALALGTLVSPTQWYWAVVGAYIVVTTTSSRGAGLRKAVDRVVGTALGVLAGLGVAALLADLASVELAVLSVLLFGTFWVFRINYRWMMLLLTVTVAVLYELTGQLTVEVLALRLAETALGAAVAGLVVFFVLPTSTRRTVDTEVVGLLGALDGLLGEVAAGRVTTPTLRAVDAAVSSVRESTAPLVTTAPTRIGDEVRAARLLATALRVRAGALATVVAHSRPTVEDQAALAVLREHLGHLRTHLEAPGTTPPPPDPRPFPATDGPVGAVLRAVDDRLTGYATARGLALRPDPGSLAGGTARWRD